MEESRIGARRMIISLMLVVHIWLVEILSNIIGLKLCAAEAKLPSLTSRWCNLGKYVAKWTKGE